MVIELEKIPAPLELLSGSCPGRVVHQPVGSRGEQPQRRKSGPQIGDRLGQSRMTVRLGFCTGDFDAAARRAKLQAGKLDDREACTERLTVERIKEVHAKLFERKWNPTASKETIARAKATLEKQIAKRSRSEIRHCIYRHYNEIVGKGSATPATKLLWSMMWDHWSWIHPMQRLKGSGGSSFR